MRRMIAIAVVLGSSAAAVGVAPVARAGSGEDPAVATARAAEALRAAMEAMDAARALPEEERPWEAIAQQFLAAADGARLLKRRDEALYHAALAFAHAGLYERAFAVTKTLADDHPYATLTRRARFQGAHARHVLGLVVEAAAEFDDYADDYPDDADARHALENAILLHAAIGQDKRAVALLDRFAARYRATAPDDVAAITLWLAADAERDDRPADAIALYKSGLAGFRPGGDRGAMIRHADGVAALAALRWRESCPVPLVDGLCARRPPPARGASGPGVLTAVARDRTRAAAAQELLAQAVQLGAILPPDERRPRIVLAALLRAEAEVEAALAVGPVPPQVVDARGVTTSASMKAMQQWLETWRRQSEQANRALEAVLVQRDPASAIAAIARIGVLVEAMADTIASVPVPPALRRDPEMAKIFVGALDDFAEPLRQRARDAASACLAKASELGVFGDDVASCQRLVDRLDPSAFPLAERFARPTFLPPTLELAPPIMIDPTAPPPPAP